MVKPWAPLGTASDQTDGLQQYIGILYLVFIIPFMGVITMLLVPLIKQKLRLTSTFDSPTDSQFGMVKVTEESSLLEKPHKRQKEARNVPLIVLLSFVFVFLPLIMLGVFLLPPIWNVPITVYRNFVSPNSVVQWMPWGTGPTDFTFKFYIDTLGL
jgi:TRAP-type mannitol/chloroaromatic compound transport system permease small subunit